MAPVLSCAMGTALDLGAATSDFSLIFGTPVMLSSKYSLLTTSALVALSSVAVADPVVSNANQAVGASNISISAGSSTPVAATSAPVSATASSPVNINSDRPNYTIEFAQPAAPAPTASAPVTAPSTNPTVATTAAPVSTTVPAAPVAAPAPVTTTSAVPAPSAAPAPVATYNTAPVNTPATVAPVAAPAPQGSALASGPMPTNTATMQSVPAANANTVNAAGGAMTSLDTPNQGYITEQLSPAPMGSTGASMSPNAGSPSFTFEQQNPANGALANGSAPGNVTMGAAGPLQPEVGEQQQEVSVTVLGNFDQALTDAFKSLESGITLGLGDSSAITVDQIAPAIRGIDTDEMGNLVVRFSLPVAERILKQQGALSWQGLSNPVLVWMVGLDGTSSVNELTMVSGQNLSAFAQAILQAAPDYKYRLMFPILDLEDMQKVNVNTVLDHQDQVLAEASSRYGADYFIAAAISSVPNESGVTLKWNLYNRDGIAIANSSLSGVMDEVATLGAGDIARALMTFQENLDHGTETVNQLKANNVDIEMLGPGEGFVRMRIGNIRTLQDIKGIRSAFATYGFDGDTRVVGYDNGQFVIEIATNSNPTNIEGTLRHGGDFTYLGPWSFNFRNSSTGRAPLNTTVSSARSDRPNSQLSNPVSTPAPSGALSSR